MFPQDHGDGPGMRAAPVPPTEARFGRPVDAVRLAWVLRQRWRLIALAVALGIPAGALVAKLFVPRTYTAEAVLVWERPHTRVVVDPERELKTLLDTVKMPGNVAELRRRTGQPLTLESLARRLNARVGRDSNLLTLSAEADDAAEAARLCDTMTQVFLEGCREVERTRAEERFRALGEEAERVRSQLSALQAQYDGFRKQHGIADLVIDRRSAIEEAALLRTEANRNRIEVESRDAKAALLRLVAKDEPSMMVMSETQIRAAERKLAELRADLTAREARLTQEHPEVLGLAAAVQALETSPAGTFAPGDRILGTNPQWTFLRQSLLDADAEREAAQRKWKSYAELEAAARSRVSRLSTVEGQAALMLAELHVLESRLGELKALQKVAEGELHQPSAGFRVLTAATPPSRPTRSHRRAVAAALPLLLGFFATLLCAAQALRGLRLWTPAEIAFWGRGPVVAASTWPTQAEGLEELVLDLAASASAARGVTLVVALSRERMKDAAELVSRLERVAARGDGAEPRGTLEVWTEPDRSQALRRAARQSARVLVLAGAGAHSLFELMAVHRRLGREERIGFVVLGLGRELAGVSDRVGDVAGFWGEPGAVPEPMRPPPRPMEC